MAAMSLREMVTRWPYPSADNHPQNWHCGTACTGNKHIFFLTSSRKPNPNLNGVLLTWGGLNTSQTQNAKNSDPKRHTQSFFIFVCAFFFQNVETWTWNSIPQKWSISNSISETSHQKGYVSNFKFQPFFNLLSTISSFQPPPTNHPTAPPRWSPAPSSLNRTKAEAMTLGRDEWRSACWELGTNKIESLGKCPACGIPRVFFWTLQVLHQPWVVIGWKPHSLKRQWWWFICQYQSYFGHTHDTWL